MPKEDPTENALGWIVVILLILAGVIVVLTYHDAVMGPSDPRHKNNLEWRVPR